MSTHISPLAGQPATPAQLVNIPRLVTAYYALSPDPSVPAQRVAFGTSGHRGSAFDTTFNEGHVLAITQAICDYRRSQGITGPLYCGIDTHALSAPASASAVEVLAANGVEVVLAAGDEYTPTPAVSHAILAYNRSRTTGLADGIVVTPSHNPPDNGGFKYNPPHGGPAETSVTQWIEQRANSFLEKKLAGVQRMAYAKALQAATTHRHDYLSAYVNDLGNAVDLALISSSQLHLGVHPLGGAGVHYWARIAEQYRLDLTVLSDAVDPTFRFMTLDWDGRIRMDPSSPYAMQPLIACKDRFDLLLACDTDHDRHGIVTPQGLLPPNHYLTVMIDYLFQHRPQWPASAVVGKTVVSTQLIDRVCHRLGRSLLEVPVGFKWFAAGLVQGSIGFCGEESAGAAFLRRDGTVWTSDKDGITAALLAAEITARCGDNPATLYAKLGQELGLPLEERVEAPATPEQKQRLAALTPQDIHTTQLAGENISSVQNTAPGNGAPIGGIKISTTSGWFAARPSGTEAIYKIYAESFKDAAHLQALLQEAQSIVDRAITPAP